MSVTAYPTATYRSILEGAARRRGIEPGGMSVSDKAKVAEFAGDRLRVAWQWGAWPDWSPVETVATVGEWDGAAYPAGATVWYAPTGLYYRAPTGVAVGVEPPASPWVVTGAPRRQDMATVFNVYATDPRDNPRARKVPFVKSSAGLVLSDKVAVNPVWVHFRLSAPQVTSAVWVVEAEYQAGDLVYEPATGDCWVAIEVNTGEMPGPDSTKWARQLIPQILANYLKAGVAADWLRGGGKDGEADRQDGRAQGLLVDEYAKAMEQTGALEI